VQDETAYYWYVGRADDVIIAGGVPDRPFESSPPASAIRPAEACCGPRPPHLRGNVVKAFVVLADGYSPPRSSPTAIKTHVRKRSPPTRIRSRIEFVADLPKTFGPKDPPHRDCASSSSERANA